MSDLLGQDLKSFRSYVEKLYGVSIPDSYDQLQNWSIENIERLWNAVVTFCDIKLTSWSRVLEHQNPQAPPPKWFTGSSLNYAENLLKFRDDKIALVCAGEFSTIRKISYSELYSEVRRLGLALAAAGVGKDDVVAGYLPNSAMAVIAMLATAWLGACWTSASPDFGVQGVCERFSRAKPKILFTIPDVIYNGKRHDNVAKVFELAQKLDCLHQIVFCPAVGEKIEENAEFSHIPKSTSLSNFLKFGDEMTDLDFVQIPFDHPLFIMYTSGTTGPPKCMVHGVGGTLVKHLQEHKIQESITREDVMLFYTTTGWMMWNWMVSALALGCTLVLYDGSPLMPTKNRLWDLVDQLGITILGTSPRWLSVLEESGIEPRKTHSLDTLRMLMSTGAPLRTASFEYVHRSIKEDVVIASISGGTDIIGVFMGQNYDRPTDYGVMKPYLGCALEARDAEGNKVKPGEAGNLVLTKPIPSFPVRFLDDPDWSVYKSAYFQSYENVWSHGDHCVITDSGIRILGRSDAVLNPSGVRFGAAEIYNIVETIPGITDSLCTSQLDPNADEKVFLFVKMSENTPFTDDIRLDIRKRIREGLSARHVPHVILEAKEIPYTSSGKKMELIVKNILSHIPVKNLASVSNPGCLDYFHGIAQNGVS